MLSNTRVVPNKILLGNARDGKQDCRYTRVWRQCPWKQKSLGYKTILNKLKKIKLGPSIKAMTKKKKKKNGGPCLFIHSVINGLQSLLQAYKIFQMVGHVLTFQMAYFLFYSLTNGKWAFFLLQLVNGPLPGHLKLGVIRSNTK